MTLIRSSLLVAAVAVSLSAGFATSADAASCGARMSGEGTGMGVAGQGTEKAKAAALANWSSKVLARYGSKRYGSNPTQSAVRFDCRSGAVLEAKCVVTARPCK